jgi:hypothetical protein
MNRNLIIIFSFLFAQNIHSQSMQATQWEEKRATTFTSYIAENLEMNDRDKEFVHQVMLDRVVNARLKIRGNNLTQEEKKMIFQSEYANAQSRLAEHFDVKTARKIMSLSNEARKAAETK